jgi:hypothetical protein
LLSRDSQIAATHPTTFEGDCFYSADLVGSLRVFLRDALGEDLGVAYLTGAAGNTAPLDIEHDRERSRPWYGEEGWRRAGEYLGRGVLEVIESAKPMPNPVLRLAQEVVRQARIESFGDSRFPGRLQARANFIGLQVLYLHGVIFRLNLTMLDAHRTIIKNQIRLPASSDHNTILRELISLPPLRTVGDSNYYLPSH